MTTLYFIQAYAPSLTSDSGAGIGPFPDWQLLVWQQRKAAIRLPAQKQPIILELMCFTQSIERNENSIADPFPPNMTCAAFRAPSSPGAR